MLFYALAAGCASAPPASAVPASAPSPLVMPTAPASTTATFTNSLGMRFVRIDAGEFLMGSDESPSALAAAFPTLEAERFADLADEAPVHRVRISRAFHLGQHEVTVGQFAAFVAASGYVPESIADATGGYGYDKSHDREASARREVFSGRDPVWSWRNPGFAQGDDDPVVNVTWNDAQALATWLSRREGRIYRLPTEAEWEYACRAGSRTRYHGGDAPAVLLGIGNLFDADSARLWPQWAAEALPGSDGYAFTAPVGRFAANAWGLFDMHGNVWEWVSDWYGADYYARSPLSDPTGPADGDVRVRRGGSWHTWPFYARAAFRNWNAPDTRYVLVGIRLAVEIGDGAPSGRSADGGR